MPTYTTLDAVRSLLETASAKNINFSNSISGVQITEKGARDPHYTDGGIDTGEFDYTDSFSEQMELILKFKDSTTFDVFLEKEHEDLRTLLDKDQDISNDYTIPSGNLTIKSSAWIGTYKDNVKVVLKFNPHVSNNRAKKYIEDVEVEIDSIIESEPADKKDDGDARLFNPNDNRPVPNEIELATKYLTAYWIYTDVFSSIKQQTEVSYTNRWKKRAFKQIDNYIDKVGYSGPKSKVFPHKIDQLGIPGIASGSEKLGDIIGDSGSKDIFEDQLSGV